MPQLLPLFALSLLSLTGSAWASPCVSFDSDWNLLAFGFNGKDYDAGKQSSWTSGSSTDITKSGRPAFDGTNTTCYLSQYTNTIYILGAEKSAASAVHLYNVADKTWSSRSPSINGFDPTSFVANLDHDTDVLYAMSKGNMWSLNMTAVTLQEPGIQWNDVGKPSFTTDGYDVVMGLASNHIHFINVPGTPAGSSDIFVIHYSYFQPEKQRFGDFPAQHGQTASVFLESNKAQEEFVYVPDDGSATYVINVMTNTTKTLAGPSDKAAAASYLAAPGTLVQLTWRGISYLPYAAGAAANDAAKWSPVVKLADAVAASATTTPSTNGSSTSGNGATSGNNTTGGGTTGNNNNAAMPVSATIGLFGAFVLSATAVFLL